jgi:hypothetical protein
MLHPAQSKPQIPRTKLFPTTSARNKSGTSKCFSSSANLTHIASSLGPVRVGVMSKYFDMPRRQSFNFPERNTECATHRSRSTPTRNFYFPSAHITPIASSLRPVHVRVFSEYSDIQDQTNLDCPDQNTRFATVERKSTLTSFLNFRALVGQAFEPDKCAYPSSKPSAIYKRIRQARKPDLRSAIASQSGSPCSIISPEIHLGARCLIVPQTPTLKSPAEGRSRP